MLLSKRRFRFVQRVIASWESGNVITSSEAEKLRASIELAKGFRDLAPAWPVQALPDFK
ncbi:MAG TPA: hypothetical protein GXZ26_11085 [Firmicutes bacterium]|nr:hypothetical protein [Bacillota bacterium]